MKLIDKDALVAEIKRRKELVSDPILSDNDLMIGERNALFNLLQFIDTLEVKEVDFDREVDKWYNNKASKEFEKVFYDDIEKCAKYFFELGLSVIDKARRGE